MIRKPGEEDFRESQAIMAMRESKKIAVEGSRGVGKGLARIYLMLLAVVMGFGIITYLMSAMGGIGFLIIMGGAAWWHKGQRGTAMSRESAIAQAAFEARAGYDRYGAAQGAMPATSRRQGIIYLDISQVMQQAVTLFFVGLMLVLMTARSNGAMAPFTILGMALFALAVLVAARVVGDRKVLEWDASGVTVHHLLGKARAQWSDVRDIAVLKSAHYDLSTYVLSGASRNLELIVPFNRLGGATRLVMPLRLTTMDDADLEALLYELMGLQAAAQQFAAPRHTPPQWQQQQWSPPPPPVESFTSPRARTHYRDEEDEIAVSRARDGFDPDAIVARYVREREALQDAEEQRREAQRDAEARRRAALAGPPRAGGFGRKGL